MIRSTLLFPVFLVLSFKFSASARTCLASELQSLANREKLSKVLAAVPTLRGQLIRIIEDPNIPRSLKVVIKKALVDHEIHVVNLTNEIRQKWMVDPELQAFVQKPYIIPTWKYYTAPKTWTDAASDSMKPEFNRPLGIAVPDAPNKDVGQQLVYLIHELAHIRFESYLKANLSKICGKMSKTFCNQAPDGRWQMSRQLYQLLHEKFAHEMDFAILHKTHGTYFNDWDSRWPTEMRGMNLNERTAFIGQHVAKHYEITDPHVLALADEPISKVLLGGRLMKEADEAASLYSRPRLERPRAEEFPIALAMVRAMRSAAGQPTTQTIDVKKLVGDLRRLLASEDGRSRVSELVRTSWSVDPTRGQALTSFFAQSEIRSFLNREVGWQIPEKAQITIKELRNADPDQIRNR